MVDIKITTVMDLELKTAFDLALAPTGQKKFYKEALEKGALDMLAEIDPIKASELRVKKYMQLIKEEHEMQANLKSIQQLTKQEVKKEVEEDCNLEESRLAKYENTKTRIATQVNNNTIDWKVIASPSLFNFKTPYEAETWVKDKLFKEGLIGCTNCKKWKQAEEYCSEKKNLSKPTQTCRNFKRR